MNKRNQIVKSFNSDISKKYFFRFEIHIAKLVQIYYNYWVLKKMILFNVLIILFNLKLNLRQLVVSDLDKRKLSMNYPKENGAPNRSSIFLVITQMKQARENSHEDSASRISFGL